MSEAAACQAPRFIPSRANPAGDCGRPASFTVARGTTGTHLPVCEACAPLFSNPVPMTPKEPA